MQPFKERLFEKVNFFIFDPVEDLTWTNSDLTIITDEEPPEGYRI